MEFVGDIRELPGLLKMLSVPYNASLPRGRDRVDIKERFPRNITLLSNQTLRGICDFVAIDFFFV